VPFFRALASEFRRRGHEVETTAREFAQTVELAETAGLAPAVVGRHGGGKLAGKAGSLFGRALALMRWARGDVDGLRAPAREPSRVPARVARRRAARVPRGRAPAIRRARLEGSSLRR